MPGLRIGVIADDTTGALELGALLADEGISCRVLLDPDAEPGDVAALVLDTASRNLPPAEAAITARHAALKLRQAGAEWIYKKTDSTLRGPIASELKAIQDVFPESTLVYTPAYPLMGRTVRNGVLLVDGVPISQTVFARDVSEGLAVPMLNAENEDDLARLGTPPLAAGAGGFARHWVRGLPGPRIKRAEWPRVQEWQLVCGSQHPLSLHQAAFSTSIRSWTGQRPLPHQGLIVFGGDTAREVFLSLGARRLTPLGEVLAGVPLSILDSEPGPVPVITKAGAFGPENVVEQILQKMSQP